MADDVVTITDLGTLGGNSGYARGCSADGAIVVGYAQRPFDTTIFDYRNGAFRWTEAGGMVDLGNMPAEGARPEGHSAAALACSSDGNVIVGEYFYDAGSFGAFRWTEAGGMIDLGNLGYVASVSALAVSADGNVVVGRAQPSSGAQSHAWRWTEAGGMVDLGAFSSFAAAQYSEATAVSDDGSVVIGRAYTDTTSFISRAFRWTEAGGMVDLGTLGGDQSFAYCCSADGSVIFGRAQNISGIYSGYRWTESGGMVDIGDIKVTACSDDGTIGYGFYWPPSNPSGMACKWTADHGIVDLGTLGGDRSEAWACSSNGIYAAGYSRAASGWDLPAVWHVAPPPPFWAGFINCEDV